MHPKRHNIPRNLNTFFIFPTLFCDSLRIGTTQKSFPSILYHYDFRSTFLICKEKKTLKKFVTSQYSTDELYTGKGIRLDAYLEDEDKVIDIEMQTVIKKDEGLRMRYYQSMIDIDHLNHGESYSDLKESYIVFICLDDPFWT